MYFATAEDMSTLDNAAVENGLEIKQMMELAGFNILNLFKHLQIDNHKKITILVGKGNKGGDGLTAARHLGNYGFEVSVVIISKDLQPEPEHQLNLIKKMAIGIHLFYETTDAPALIRGSDVIIDAMIGYRLKGSPKGDYRNATEIANDTDSYKIAYDIPTGIEPSTGKCNNPCFIADATLTLGLPKRAFKTAKAKKFVGELYLADIGIPEHIYDIVKKGCRPGFSISKRIIKID